MANILIVDDEKSIRNTFKAFIEKEGHSADTAENVEIALRCFGEKEYDLVISDIIMPHSTGMELLAALSSSNPDVPVIIMTGEPTVETAKQAVKSAAFDYLVKPINKDALLRSVRTALDYKNVSDSRKRLEAENEQYRFNLEKLVEMRTGALQDAMRATIHTISSILELRDAYTAGHQRRVGNLAAAIAKKMGLGKALIDCLYVSGYLHDIGKLSVPAEILSKPSKLSDIEFEFVKTHAKSGYDVLNKIDWHWPVAKVVYQHHERINGSGYPRGLSGDEICLEARILAVADVIEAMSSHRPYRASLGLKAALSEIESGGGTVYDTGASQAALGLFRQDGYIFEDDVKEVFFDIS